MKKTPRMTLDEIVSRMVEEKGLSRKQIFELIEKKKSTLSWMISDEGAADIVAKELGVELYPDFGEEDLSLTIGDLVAGMSNVTITGRVTRVSPTREFTDRSGGKGLVANLTIADKSGDTRAVLWGETAKLVQESKVREGAIIRIHDGYVREDLGGRIELHVGRKGRVETAPSDVRENDFPSSQKKPTKIKDLNADTNEVDVSGVVQTIYATKVIQTKEGKEVKLSSLIIADETGATVRVVFWNDKTSLMETVRIGDCVEIGSGRVRVNMNRETEIHIGSSTQVKVNPPKTISSIRKMENILDTIRTRPSSGNVSVQGIVTEEPQFKQFIRSGGAPGKILSFTLSDNTASIRVVAWGENAEKLRELRKNYSIKIKEGRLKPGLGDKPEIHITEGTLFETAGKKDQGISMNQLPEKETRQTDQKNRAPRKKIYELGNQESAEIRGMVTKIQNRSPAYRACPMCFRKVSKKEEEWFCPKHGDLDHPVVRVLYSFIIDDGTDTIRCTLSGEPGEQLLGMKQDDIARIIDNEEGESEPSLSSILGIDIVLVGRCFINQNLGNREFRVIRVAKPDPRVEARKLMEHINNEFAV